MIRQENIQLQSPVREFKALYKPLGNRYLRGLESYLYHKDLKPISEAQRLVAKGINPLGVRPVNAVLPLPANATPAQTQEWILRTQALRNPRVDSGAEFKPYVSGWATDGINRQQIEKTAMGLVYTEARIASTRTQNVLPIY